VKDRSALLTQLRWLAIERGFTQRLPSLSKANFSSNHGNFAGYQDTKSCKK
jgi:hypothetical protein